MKEELINKAYEIAKERYAALGLYMLLAKKMWENPTEYCEGWNFGPEQESVLTVWEVASATMRLTRYSRITFRHTM